MSIKAYLDQSNTLNAPPERGEPPATRHGGARLSLPAKGQHDQFPELTYTPTGVEDEIAAITWLGSHVANSVTAEVYTTGLKRESKLPNGQEEFSPPRGGDQQPDPPQAPDAPPCQQGQDSGLAFGSHDSRSAVFPISS
ncbi:hypothetical protein ACFS3C_01630 [Azotobacter vinelandii]